MTSRLVSQGTSVLFWVAFIFWFFTSIRGNRKQARETAKGDIEFMPSLLGVIAMLYVFGHLSWTLSRNLLHSIHSTPDLMILAASLLLVVGIFRSTPGGIALNDRGIEQRFWLGKNRFIPWEEIEEINVIKANGPITITDRSGRKIVYSNSLPDRLFFLSEIKQHCGPNLPPEFPAEPIA